jgi:hypothetical protein
MEIRGLMVSQTNLNGRFHCLRSTMKHAPGGAQESYMTQGQPMEGDTSAAFTYEDSHIIGTHRSIGLGLDNVNVTGIRSVFEFPTGLAINAPRREGWIHRFTNCAWLWGGNNTFPAVILNPGDGGDGTLVIDHCTLVNGVTTTTTNGNASVLWSNAADPGFIVGVTVRNSILDLKGSTFGLIQDRGAAGTTSTDPTSPLTTGVNLRTYAATLTKGDRLTSGTGTIIDAPHGAGLQADKIHLLDNSPAVGQGADLGITDDIDLNGAAGQVANHPRPFPAASNPDLGCDEIYLVPVELSTFQLE